MQIGADLSHVFCTEGAATVIKGYSPELIVHPYLPDGQESGGQQVGRAVAAPLRSCNTADEACPACSLACTATSLPGPTLCCCPQLSEAQAAAAQRRAVQAIEPWLDRFDAVVIGPGLGRDPVILSTVAEVGEPGGCMLRQAGSGSRKPCAAAARRRACIPLSSLQLPLPERLPMDAPQVMRAVRRRALPMVVDADGLWLVNQDPSLVAGAPRWLYSAAGLPLG